MASKQQNIMVTKLLKKQALEAKRKEAVVSAEGGQGVENQMAKCQKMGAPSPQVDPAASQSKGSYSTTRSEDWGKGPTDGANELLVSLIIDSCGVERWLMAVNLSASRRSRVHLQRLRCLM
ncbi:hypothetical protein SESBI_13171 [Sesbania bispinosa]|nr:hypothetical protein SESBI_13171 [Sesbania bispinosa]